MKVLDLQCPHGHRFEGWFASAEDFEEAAAIEHGALRSGRMTEDAMVRLGWGMLKRIGWNRLNSAGLSFRRGNTTG